MKRLVIAALIAATAALGLTACDPCEGSCSTDTGPHGIIYVPPMGKSPGVGPIFY